MVTLGVVQAEEGMVDYKRFTRIELPSDSNRVLLLAARAGEGILFKAVADNLNTSDRDWLYINTSDAPLVIQLGQEGEPVGIRPGESVFHRADVEYGRGAAVRVAVRKEAEWKPVYSRFWPIREGQRMIIIFMEKEGEMVVSRFSDTVERRTPAQPQAN